MLASRIGMNSENIAINATSPGKIWRCLMADQKPEKGFVDRVRRTEFEAD